MNYLIAIGIGIFAGVIVGLGWGIFAADTYTRSFGAGDGGGAMAGFFVMAPVGFIVGFLVASGFMLRATVPAVGRGLLWGGGVMFALGVVLFVMPWVMKQRESGRFARINLEMEFEVDAKQPTEAFRWGYQGHALEGRADFPLIEERIEGTRKVFLAKMNMGDFPERRIAWFSVSGVPQQFEVPVAGQVTTTTEWSDWKSGDNVRFRWRMH